MDIILYANVLPISFAYQAEFWKNHPAQAAVQAAEKHGGSLGPWSRSSLSRSIQIYPANCCISQIQLDPYAPWCWNMYQHLPKQITQSCRLIYHTWSISGMFCGESYPFRFQGSFYGSAGGNFYTGDRGAGWSGERYNYVMHHNPVTSGATQKLMEIHFSLVI